MDSVNHLKQVKETSKRNMTLKTIKILIRSLNKKTLEIKEESEPIPWLEQWTILLLKCLTRMDTMSLLTGGPWVQFCLRCFMEDHLLQAETLKRLV